MKDTPCARGEADPVFGGGDPRRIVAALADLGLNDREIAKYFGLDCRTIRNYRVAAKLPEGALVT